MTHRENLPYTAGPSQFLFHSSLLLQALHFADHIIDLDPHLGDIADLRYMEVSRFVRLKVSEDGKMKETKEV